MDDDIQLPPLPHRIAAHSFETVMNYARAAVLADRERRAEQAPPARPKVRRSSIRINVGTAQEMSIAVCYLDDGRAWIDSERNRELARRLRIILPRLYASAPDLTAAAAALDGGVR